MLVAVCLLAMVLAFVFIWRGADVRVVLLVTSLAIGFLAGNAGTVFRTIAETLGKPKFLLPICSAMAFSFVVRETGCVEALVRLLLRPIQNAKRLLLPGGAAVAFVVNAAIPSQTSTFAAVGPLLVALTASVGAAAAAVGTALVFGASIAGALLNPGVADIVALSTATSVPSATIVVALAPAAVLAFSVGLTIVLIARRLGVGRNDAALAPLEADARALARPAPAAYKALLPPLPIVVLLLSHPSLPSAPVLARLLPRGLEVFTVMLAGALLTIAIAGGSDRGRAGRALLDGLGYAFAHVITIIAASAGAAKALEGAGVLSSFVNVTSGNVFAAFGATYLLAFALAIVSGSGTASAVALIGAVLPHAARLGMSPIALGGVILFGAEAGRTTSPVAAVLLFGSEMVGVPPRTLTLRLVVPCVIAGAVGAAYCAALLG